MSSYMGFNRSTYEELIRLWAYVKGKQDLDKDNIRWLMDNFYPIKFVTDTKQALLAQASARNNIAISTEYQVWTLCYDKDYNITDFSQLEGTFKVESVAKWFIENYNWSKPHGFAHAVVQLEKVRITADGEECVDVLCEVNL